MKLPVPRPDITAVVAMSRKTLGFDVFVEAAVPAKQVGETLTQLAPLAGLKLKIVSNRGTQVFPSKGAENDCVDQWRCRLMATAEATGPAELAELLDAIEKAGWRWMHIEKLEEINGAPGFTRAQGED